MTNQVTPGGMSDTPMPFDDFEPYPPRWPKVIGWISLVFGSLGVLCTACGATWLAILPDVMKGNPGIDVNNLPPAMKLNPLIVAQMAMGVLFSLVLIAAGGLTLGRQKLGRVLHMVWAVLSMLSAAFGFYVQFHQQKLMTDWIRDNPDSMFAKNQSPIGMYIGLACGVIVGMGYPIFCLVWFGLVKRRHEQMLKRSSGPSDLP